MQLHTSQSLERVHGLDASKSHPSFAAAAIRVTRTASRWNGRAVYFWRLKKKSMRDYRNLLAMPDHRLRDIGLPRHAILDAMAEERSYWRAKW